jgi:SAM-dependent methyltransferase
LDVGTGNGHFLFRLRAGSEEDDEDEGGEGSGSAWKGKMMGVDYSEKSVEFARRIAKEKKLAREEDIVFKWWDIMTQSPDEVILAGRVGQGWDVVCDKGTFDAISLSEEKDAQGRRMCEGYKERVVPLIREGGILLITSCNWTEEELRGWFEGGELGFVDRIVYRSFSFGGRKGQTISSVCFRKRGLS